MTNPYCELASSFKQEHYWFWTPRKLCLLTDCPNQSGSEGREKLFCPRKGTCAVLATRIGDSATTLRNYLWTGHLGYFWPIKAQDAKDKMWDCLGNGPLTQCTAEKTLINGKSQMIYLSGYFQWSFLTSFWVMSSRIQPIKSLDCVGINPKTPCLY